MSRFVEFTKAGSRLPVWINVERIDGVQADATEPRLTQISCSGPDNVWWVVETVPEVMAKLQGEREPAKAADDITGWWVDGDRVIYVIGFSPDGRIAYLWDNGRGTTHDDAESLATWTRDPNRKGWDR